MKKYVIVDLLNMAFRAKNATRPGTPIDIKIGMALHVTFASMQKVWRQFNPDHVVICLEGRSWRKDVYEGYKRNRKVLQEAKPLREQEDDKLFFEAISSLQDFLINKTNVTVLQNKVLEADDLIAFWIKSHPEDQHIIVSSDSDFVQLLADNVKLYNGIEQKTIGLDGVFDDKGKPIIDKKTKSIIPPPDPEWHLFYKCIRGDSTDNIFPAFPGAREKGSKKTIGMRDAFADRNDKGFNWNSFMLSRWVDENNVEHRVKDKYEFNRKLIDLKAQPDEIVAEGMATIEAAKAAKNVPQVGAHFMKFCGKWALNKLAEYPQQYADMLNKGLDLHDKA